MNFRNYYKKICLTLLKKEFHYNRTGVEIRKRLICSKSTMEGQGYLLNQIVGELESFADSKSAEHWDNVGLLVEPSHPHRVTNVLLTNDLTLPVLEEAVCCKANMIISYHPPIFAPLKRLTQSNWKEKLIATCLENKMAVYSPHTSWDAAIGGVGDSLASAFSDYSTAVGPIVADPNSEQMYDVMTVAENIETLKNQFGAEIICSFNCETHGLQSLLKKEIYRIIASKKMAELIACLPNTMVTKVDKVNMGSSTCVGMGRLIQLKAPGCSLQTCVQLMKCYAKLDYLRLAKGLNHNLDSLVKTVAVVPGSGGSLLKGVSADLYITGEMFHHDILDATHRNISVILTNHSDSERPFLVKFCQYLVDKFPAIKVTVSTADKDPIETV